MFLSKSKIKISSKKCDFVEDRSSWQDCYFIMRSQDLSVPKSK